MLKRIFNFLKFFLDCTKKTEAFEAGVEVCRSKSGAEACTCWDAPTLGADIATIRTCSRKCNQNVFKIRCFLYYLEKYSNKLLAIP